MIKRFLMLAVGLLPVSRPRAPPYPFLSLGPNKAPLQGPVSQSPGMDPVLLGAGWLLFVPFY